MRVVVRVGARTRRRRRCEAVFVVSEEAGGNVGGGVGGDGGGGGVECVGDEAGDSIGRDLSEVARSAVAEAVATATVGVEWAATRAVAEPRAVEATHVQRLSTEASKVGPRSSAARER